MTKNLPSRSSNLKPQVSSLKSQASSLKPQASSLKPTRCAQRRRGKWAGGRPILGYDVDRTGPSPKLVVNATEASRGRQIFAMYLKLGSLLPVVEELTKRGWQNKSWFTRRGEPRGGRAFDKSSVYDLLMNPLYAGKLKHKAEQFDGEHEAIIDPETFEKVQSQLKEHSRGKGNFLRNQNGALLKRLIHCQACGRAMVHTFTGRGAKRYRYYTCTKAMKQGYKSCPAKSLPAAAIERVVIEQLKTLGRDKALRAEILRQSAEQRECDMRDWETEQRQRDRQLARHQAESRQLLAAPAPSQANSARIVELHDQIDRVQRRLVEIKQQTDRMANRLLTDADIDAAFDNFDALWNSLPTREQIDLLRLLVARIEFVAESGPRTSWKPQLQSQGSSLDLRPERYQPFGRASQGDFGIASP